METLASRYSLDKYYLQTLTQHAGISPNEYLIATRMHRAKEMLCTTQMLIVEVAEAVVSATPPISSNSLGSGRHDPRQVPANDAPGKSEDQNCNRK